MNPLLRLALGAAAVAAVTYVAWRAFGAFGILIGSVLLGLLAKRLLDVVAAYPRFVSHLVMRKVEGRYFEYRGMSLDIHIDADARCWISTHDLRKLVALPADAVLQRLVPPECDEGGDPLQWRITVEGLAQVLVKSKEPDVTKLCRWLEVDVAKPARTRRARDPWLR